MIFEGEELEEEDIQTMIIEGEKLEQQEFQVLNFDHISHFSKTFLTHCDTLMFKT